MNKYMIANVSNENEFLYGAYLLKIEELDFKYELLARKNLYATLDAFDSKSITPYKDSKEIVPLSAFKLLDVLYKATDGTTSASNGSRKTTEEMINAAIKRKDIEFETNRENLFFKKPSKADLKLLVLNDVYLYEKTYNETSFLANDDKEAIDRFKYILQFRGLYIGILTCINGNIYTNYVSRATVCKKSLESKKILFSNSIKPSFQKKYDINNVLNQYSDLFKLGFKRYIKISTKHNEIYNQITNYSSSKIDLALRLKDNKTSYLEYLENICKSLNIDGIFSSVSLNKYIYSQEIPISIFNIKDVFLTIEPTINKKDFNIADFITDNRYYIVEKSLYKSLSKYRGNENEE